MMPPHQMPAASPKPERLADKTSVKAILTKVNHKLDAPPCRCAAHIRCREHEYI